MPLPRCGPAPLTRGVPIRTAIRLYDVSLLLQHASRDVTGRHYVDLSDVLREVVDKFPLPVGFNSGANMAARVESQVRKARAEVYADDFHYPEGPIPADWRFKPGGFSHRGTWHRMKGRPLAVLRMLTRTSEPLSVPDLLPTIMPGADSESKNVQTRVQVVISQLRRRLRRCLGLEPGWDCLPCVECGHGGRWILHVPHTLGRETPHTPVLHIERDAVTPAELRTAREAASMSQYTLAALVGISRSHVGDWESDRANIAEKWFLKLREILHPYLNGNGRASA